MSLTLTSVSGSQPAAIEWTVGYSVGVASISEIAGPALTAAGKAITCSPGTGTITCIGTGVNNNTIANGVVATVQVTLMATATTVPLTVSSTMGATLTGDSIMTSGTGGTIQAVGAPVVSVASVSCSPGSISQNGTSVCTVSLSGAAGTGGATVGLSSNLGDLAVPASVTVAAGTSTATFTASGDNFSASEVATITASLNGSSAQTAIALAPTAGTTTVTGLQCGISTLATTASTSCTVTLSQAASNGGTAVTLSDTAPAVLVVPANVTVTAGSTTASFTVFTGSFSGSWPSTLTAALGTSSVSSSLSATAGPVSLNCTATTISPGQAGSCTVSMASVASIAKSVTLQSTNVGLSVPASVTVPANASSATFGFTSSSSLSGSVIVSATAESITKSLTITVQSDTTPPTVTMTSPANGATVGGQVAVSANATDNVAVASVQFQLDGANLGQALTAAPYSVTWDTTTAASGAHILTAIAKDTSGNSATAAAVTVTVNNSSGPPTAGLIGYWNFDEGSGTVAHDTSGSGYNGTVNGATWTTGKIGDALSFNGSNSVVTPNIALANTFSISVWINPAASQGGYVRIAETQYTTGWYLGTNSTGTKYKFIVDGGTGSSGSCGVAFGCAEGGSITTGWHLISGTFDGRTGTLYVDGAVVATDTFSAPGNTSLPLFVGSYFQGGFGLAGKIDDVRLYNRALSGSEITALENYAPTVSITAPAANSTVSGSLTVTATAAGMTVATMQLQLDGSNLGTALTAAPYSVTWNTTTASNGSHTLTAIAKDVSGLTVPAAPVAVTVNNSSGPPTAGLSSVSCSPGSISQNGTSVCTVSLSGAAGTGGAAVGLSSNLSDLAVPASVTVAAGNSTATFTASGDNFSASEVATITASLNGSSAQTAITLTPSAGTPTVTGLQCGISTLATTASTSCTVTLSQAASNGGTVVTLSDTAPAVLVVPSNVTVTAGSTTASFTVYTGSFSGSWPSTLTAALGTSSVSSSLSATAGPVSLNCTATTISPGQGGSCTVSMASVASIAKSVTLQSTNVGLAVPSTVTVPANATSATFGFTSSSSLSGWIILSATAESTTKSLTITVQSDTTPPTVTMTSPANGATVGGQVAVSANATDNLAVASVQFQLDGANLGQALTAAPYSVTWDTTTAASGAHILTAIAKDTSGNSATAAAVTVTVNNSSGPPTAGLIGYWTFDEGAGTIAYDTSGSGYNGTVNGAVWAPGKINEALIFTGNSKVVTPNIALGNTFSISAWVNGASSEGGYVRIAETQYSTGFYLGADASGTRFQFTVRGGSGSTGACGVMYGCAVGGTVTTGWHLVTATYDGTTGTLYVDGTAVAADTFTAPGNTSLPLFVGSYYLGGYGWIGGIDDVRLYNRALSSAEVQAVYGYTGQSTQPVNPSAARRQGSGSGESGSGMALGVTGTPTLRPIALSCQPRYIVTGDKAVCEVVLDGPASGNKGKISLASDADAVQIPASAGARSGQNKIRFLITAAQVEAQTAAAITAQSGGTTVETNFTVLPAPASSTVARKDNERPQAESQSPLPTISSLVNGAHAAAPAACSPGSIATLQGRSLYGAATPAWDYSGTASDLAGTRVLINGVAAAIVYGSAEEVSFVCPSEPAGTTLQIAVETAAGTSNTITSRMAEAAPGIFTLERTPSARAAAFVADTGELSQLPSYQQDGLPVLPRGAVIVQATGVPCDPASTARVLAKVDQQYVPIQSLRPSAQYRGVCEITIQAPGVSGDHVPLAIEVSGSDGQSVVSNVATIAVAARD